MAVETEIVNARITSASLYLEEKVDGLTSFLNLDYGKNGGIGFGGCLLCREKQPSILAGHFVIKILSVTEAKDWKNVVGSFIRVKRRCCCYLRA